MPAGDKTLAIEVTAEDGTIQTYTFTFEAQGGDVPAAPSRPTIESVSHNSVTIAWNDPGDSSVTGYQVLRRNPAIHDTGEFVVIEDDTGSPDTSYEDTTVAPETNYVYRVKARNAHGLSEGSLDRSVTTPAEPTPPNQAATGLPTIAGTPRVGETLSANTSGIGDANGLANVQFNYQWIHSNGNSDTSIPGATGQTHTLTGDDQGKTIKVSVSFT
ncbi:MAG: fibronectin type III domain-containing protein, partial [Acidimicrobiia bacterium]|nr:fibronectin type III domain-containing protein [Acidimicrobiia bacterium]